MASANDPYSIRSKTGEIRAMVREQTRNEFEAVAFGGPTLSLRSPRLSNSIGGPDSIFLLREEEQ